MLATSSATGEGLAELAAELLRRVPAQSEPAPGHFAGAEPEELVEHMVFRPHGAGGFLVSRTGEGSFRVSGRGIERLVSRYDIENEDAMGYLEGRLRRIGVIQALEAEGFEPGDEIEIAGVTFELDPG